MASLCIFPYGCKLSEPSVYEMKHVFCEILVQLLRLLFSSRVFLRALCVVFLSKLHVSLTEDLSLSLLGLLSESPTNLGLIQQTLHRALDVVAGEGVLPER